MIFIKKNIFLISVGFALSLVAVAQPPGKTVQKIPAGLIRQDFLLLRDTLQKLHPGLYRYQSKARMDHLFDSCFATIRDSMDVPGFYVLTRYVIASIKDGHSNCRLPDQVMDDYLGSVKVFPAMVLFLHNHAFIYCCKQNNELAEAELLSINGRPMDEIVNRLFDYIQSDGNIQSRKNWEMPENFHLLYNIIYGVHRGYEITCKTKTGEIKKASLQADNIKNVFCTNPFPRPDKYLQLSYTNGNMAVLTLKTFLDDFLKQTNENFKLFLDSSFRDIKKKGVRKLLIDMRSNQGGNDGNGEILYSYLSDSPFRYYQSQETISKRLEESENPNLALQQPHEDNYSGKTYFLINGRSFSGVAEFCSVAKSNDRGIFIGEECGGGYYGNTSGDEAMVTLPNTRIIVRIPLIKYTMAVKKTKFSDRGVIPDYAVYPTIHDIVEKKDGQLAKALIIAEKE